MNPHLDIVPCDRQTPLITDPVVNFAFELDPFQKHACYWIHNSENVLITAHTSAGKTVIAEYGIHFSKKQNKRTFYTSPIKTLSNQKYAEFCSKLGKANVGLLTGDIKCNPDAQCVIMTTEILRDMLYRSKSPTQNVPLNDTSDVNTNASFGTNVAFSDLDCVIFDEVHFINNPDRGHVWEECLMMLPLHVKLIMLSATISEPERFASWICDIRKKPLHLITTQKRPVPLNHYVYYDSGHHLILNNNRQFQEKTYLSYIKYHDSNKCSPIHLMNEFLDFLSLGRLFPAIFFTFSRKKCESFAHKITYPLTTPEDQGKITSQIDYYLSHHTIDKKVLDNIPQIVGMRNLLVKGIGVHHSGLLPIMKEITELLFSQGLIKVLFATETFAVGVNMPTKTVVFTDLMKYSNGSKEPVMLKPDEYLQMSGRAGRRGLDSFGTVIHLPLFNLAPLYDVKKLLLGNSAKIDSKFKINYQYVLMGKHISSVDNEQCFITDTSNNLYENENKHISEFTSNSYLCLQNTEVIKNFEKQRGTIEYEHFILTKKLSKYNLTPDMINLFEKLLTLEQKLTSPVVDIDGLVVKMDKKMIKKTRADILLINSEVCDNIDKSAINDIKNIVSNLIQVSNELTNLDDTISSYKNGINNEIKLCSDELTELGYLYKSLMKEDETLAEEYTFIADGSTLTSKGVIAIQLSNCDQILMTELLMSNQLDKLFNEADCDGQLTCILSLFCSDSHTSNDADSMSSIDEFNLLPPHLQQIIKWIMNCKDDLKTKYRGYHRDYENVPLNTQMMYAAYLWGTGANYQDIIPYLTIFDGNFVKNMLKLSHICDELIKSCEIAQFGAMGSFGQLRKHLTNVKANLIRNIVSFDSLYVK
jgi:superfamily II RNA helicase